MIVKNAEISKKVRKRPRTGTIIDYFWDKDVKDWEKTFPHFKTHFYVAS